MKSIMILNLCMGLIITSSFGAAFDQKTLSSPALIQYLLDKYGIKTPTDAITWETAEDIKNWDKYERTGYPETPPRKASGELLQILALLAGFKPIVSLDEYFLTIVYEKEPLLKELFSRNDHPFKMIHYKVLMVWRTPKSWGQQYIIYDSSDSISLRNALLEELYNIQDNIQTLLPLALKINNPDSYYEQAYVYGILYGYPEDAIRAYVGEQNWNKAQRLGRAWFAKYAKKSNKQLMDEFKKLYQGYLEKAKQISGQL